MKNSGASSRNPSKTARSDQLVYTEMSWTGLDAGGVVVQYHHLVAAGIQIGGQQGLGPLPVGSGQRVQRADPEGR